MERLERQYLADRTGLVTAMLQSEEGAEVEPPSFDDRLAEFDTALHAEPIPAAPLTERDRSNRLFLEVMGAA